MVTVADLVAVPALGLRVAAESSSGPTALRWVATSELVDPTPYLEGGELLLTTGLATGDWSDEWAAYVDRLADSRAAGLGLGTGLTHARLPHALVVACRERGLTLVEVPKETTFVAVSRAAAELLQDQEAASTRLALDHQRRLTRAALALDVRPLLVRLAGLLGATVALVHRDGDPAEGPLGRAKGALDLSVVRAEVARIRAHGLAAASTTVHEGVTSVVRPVGVAGRPQFYLAVAVTGQLDEPGRSAVATAGVLLSLVIERRTDRRSTERRLRGRALELLCSGDVRSATVILDAAERTTPVPDRLRVLLMTGPHEALEDTVDAIDGSEAHDEVLVGVVDGRLVAVCAPAQLRTLLALVGDGGLRVGVGRAVPAAEAPRSLESADQALARTTSTIPVRRWEEIVDAGPSALVPEELGRQYAVDLLSALDEEQRTLLAVFLREHGSRATMADVLGIHRNTVRNRLAAIERLTGLDLDDPSARVGAWMALQFLSDR
ncbi:PucR family transcriptional regulator [Terrabacter terrigena]|uniref:PucR family transcriptional regulator n=1 Tax=Terrabacter terrigena TaxID=574718 RepID=A0ABW3N2Q2_9MICO